jgi:hypothetical protein
MKLQDQWTAFCNSVSVAECRLQSLPKSVFVCGGLLSESRSKQYSSLRDYLIKTWPEASSARGGIFLAEDLNHLFLSGHYPDLLALEEDIGSLCCAIALIVESPGSIAELGAFCMIEGIAPKTIAIINQKFSDKKSFINLGPVRRIAAIDDRNVLVFPWEETKHRKIKVDQGLISSTDEIRAEIEKRIEISRSSVKFNPDNSSHVAVMMRDFLSIMGPLKVSEIKDYVAPIIKSNSVNLVIDRGIEIGLSFKILQKKKYSYHEFLTAVDSDFDVSFRFIQSRSRDIIRWKSRISSEILTEGGARSLVFAGRGRDSHTSRKPLSAEVQ